MIGKFRVKELAVAVGLTQEQLSHKSGVKLSTVQRLWQNKSASEPRASTLLAIAGALGVSIQELYTTQETEQGSPISATHEGNKECLVMARAW